MTEEHDAAYRAFTARQYGVRAADYVSSTVHAGGADLDEIERAVAGRGLARVLDLGCGGGHVSYRAAPHVGQVVACDVTPDMLDAVARTAIERGLDNIVTQRAAAESLPFTDAAFDAVLCRFTAHHWRDIDAGLREARRVLKPDGLAIVVDVTAPADPLCDSWLQTLELLRDVSHARDYSVAEWTAAFGRAGFALQGVTPRRLRMEFASWVARARTPTERIDAIRSLQRAAPEIVAARFALEDDGSFLLDTTSFTVT
ncbi:Methyltransferase type 11 [Gluconacetobacter diazotrophicus PA1 5]|uniref:class I SAM-dependent methyltransferase n=1 Tax=Gluconacetobacter diazotrophicus TaxID=33996 RepID=UPI000173CF4B|nr:methyltransferase domain-containing protein [Gluconacetobacter diazotrophicus]ACI51199.1 Methyltransferase type 11 [Gluconacetobacter diazotrophicus PA1 5]TWB09755.1 methyltransferase family protein [Gluconacetobacter diazotrophicus]